jgi:hypothetical protein
VGGLKEAPDAMKVGIVYSNLLDTTENLKDPRILKQPGKRSWMKYKRSYRYDVPGRQSIERILNAVSLQNN